MNVIIYNNSALDREVLRNLLRRCEKETEFIMADRNGDKKRATDVTAKAGTWSGLFKCVPICTGRWMLSGWSNDPISSRSKGLIWFFLKRYRSEFLQVYDSLLAGEK